MIKTVVIAFPRSFEQAQRIAGHLDATLCPYRPGIFSRVFHSADRIVALMATGIVIRSIASLVQDKWVDPAVVVVSPDLSYSIPLIGGHHGANELALELEPLGIRPVITTATEVSGKDAVEVYAKREGRRILNVTSTRVVNTAILEGDIPVYTIAGPAVVIANPAVSVLLQNGEYIVGIGCRKGVNGGEIVDAVNRALSSVTIGRDAVLACATTVKKIHEQGLLDAAPALPANLVFLDDATINAEKPHSPSKAGRIGLTGVAEPCALALSRKRELLMKKTVFGRVTVAIAR